MRFWEEAYKRRVEIDDQCALHHSGLPREVGVQFQIGPMAILPIRPELHTSLKIDLSKDVF
jgi:hypothetical protein